MIIFHSYSIEHCYKTVYESVKLIVFFSGTASSRSQILQTIKNACLPKLICELTATPERDKLSDTERNLISLLQ